MGLRPRFQRLVQCRFDVGVTARAQRPDEQLHFDELSRFRIDDVRLLPPKNRRMSSRLLDAVDASSGSASSSTDRTARNNGCSRTLPAYSPRTPPTAAATSALGDASAPRGCGHSPDPAVRQTSPAAETALPPAPRRSAPPGAASSDHPSSPWPGTHSPFQPPREVPLRSCGE